MRHSWARHRGFGSARQKIYASLTLLPLTYLVIAGCWPGQPLELGRELELNDRRAVVAAITEATASFATNVMLHTTYSRAAAYTPAFRNRLSFVAGAATAGEDRADVARRISRQTGLQALSSEDFRWMTIWYFLTKTGIPIDFGVVVLLGVIVGATIIGMTFSMFVSENMRQYGVLKAMGMNDGDLTRMVMLQVAVVGVIGYALGLGAAAVFSPLSGRRTATSGASSCRLGWRSPAWRSSQSLSSARHGAV